MQLKKNIASSESGFIFNPGTGDSFSANPLAAEILGHIKEGKPAAEIKQLLLDKYEVESGELEKDWDDFVAQLREGNLLEM
ncbi:MAG: PqqD family protein [Ferruginibacter sp.]